VSSDFDGILSPVLIVPSSARQGNPGYSFMMPRRFPEAPVLPRQRTLALCLGGAKVARRGGGRRGCVVAIDSLLHIHSAEGE
jgi:hypothetical protein